MSKVIEQLFIQKDWEQAGRLYTGMTNHCFRKDVFHAFFDCDAVRLAEVIDVAEKISENCSDVYILSSSPWRWMIASFSCHTWKEYVEMLGLCGNVVDKNYSWHVQRRGFAVLRICAKNGFVPKLMYLQKGELPECEQCKADFFNALAHYQGGRTG